MSKPNQWMIETRDLVRSYGDGEIIYALNKVNLRVAPGELVAVMGPSGSGKSTLLNILGALDQPTSGEVFVNGQNLKAIKDIDTFRAHTVGFIFQLHNLLPTLTALENIEIPMINRLPAPARRQRAKELLHLVALEDRMNHLPGQLSGGQRQRVAIARALANNPPLVLADEPTGSLDTVNGDEIMRLLRDLNTSQKTTFIVVTHDLGVARQTRRIAVMQDGKIIREDRIGTPLEEDLIEWRNSLLGQKILAGDEDTLRELGIAPEQMGQVRNLLSSPREQTGKG